MVPVEFGHSSSVMSTLENIANKLKQTLIWSPKKALHPHDEEAITLLPHPLEKGGFQIK